jgi:hypothetical protein
MTPDPHWVAGLVVGREPRPALDHKPARSRHKVDPMACRCSADAARSARAVVSLNP